jgi:hypothetical protein
LSAVVARVSIACAALVEKRRAEACVRTVEVSQTTPAAVAAAFNTVGVCRRRSALAANTLEALIDECVAEFSAGAVEAFRSISGTAVTDAARINNIN